jgi:hypothetical protein
MKLWPMVKNTSWLSDFIGDSTTEKHFWDVFNKAHEQKDTIDYWDYQWAFACWIQNGMTIIPNVNLVNNIGWDSDATHTVSRTSTTADLTMEKIEFPLSHPPHLIWHRESDVLRFRQTAQAKTQKIKVNNFFQYLKKNRLMNECYHRFIKRK